MHILNNYPELINDLESAVEWSYHSNMNTIDKATFVGTKDSTFVFALDGNEETNETSYTLYQMIHTLKWYWENYKNKE
jgi:hypothetical protein